jgi:thiamine transporter
LTIFLLIIARADKQPLTFNAKSLALAGVCISMSFALSYIKLWDMPNGGALTLASLFPLALYSYLYGLKKGLFAGFCYSLLQAIQDPWIIHPAQFLLDYPIAFTAVGLAGIFKSSKINDKAPRLAFSLGCGAVGLFRYIAHTLSGIFAFETYAKGQNAVLFSLGYNLYVLVDIALVIAVGILILSSKSLLKELAKIR